MKSDNKTIQDKVKELDKLVEWFQGDDFQLEDASATLKKAADLATEIEKDLTTISNEINEVKRSFASESEA